MNRISNLSNHFLTVTDSRNPSQSVQIAIIEDQAVKATDFAQLKLKLFEPGFMNTASCISNISFIDGDRGILRFRGVPIGQLAEKCCFIEKAF